MTNLQILGGPSVDVEVSEKAKTLKRKKWGCSRSLIVVATDPNA